MTRRKLLSGAASVIVCWGILFATLPEDQKVGPMVLALILFPIAWYVGEWAQQKTARPVPRRRGPH